MKKPPPEMARSKLLLVDLMLPWSNCWLMAAVRTPRLTASEDTPRLLPVKMSENSARDCLKPLVFTLAMLLLAMSSCVVAAFRPLIAVSKAMTVS